MTAPDKKCEHNLSIHTRYMSWCSVCGSMRHGRSKTWQLPTRPAVAEEEHFCDDCRGYHFGKCNVELPPPSGLVALDFVDVFNELKVEQAYIPLHHREEMAMKICSRFGVPGARELDVEKIFDYIHSSADDEPGHPHFYNKICTCGDCHKARDIASAYQQGKLFKPSTICKTGEKGGE